MSIEEKVRYLEEQVSMLTDMLAESQFRERIGVLERWVEEVDETAQQIDAGEIVFIADCDLRDKSKDN